MPTPLCLVLAVPRRSWPIALLLGLPWARGLARRGGGDELPVPYRGGVGKSTTGDYGGYTHAAAGCGRTLPRQSRPEPGCDPIGRRKGSPLAGAMRRHGWARSGPNASADLDGGSRYSSPACPFFSSLAAFSSTGKWAITGKWEDAGPEVPLLTPRLPASLAIAAPSTVSPASSLPPQPRHPHLRLGLRRPIPLLDLVAHGPHGFVHRLNPVDEPQ